MVGLSGTDRRIRATSAASSNAFCEGLKISAWFTARFRNRAAGDQHLIVACRPNGEVILPRGSKRSRGQDISGRRIVQLRRCEFLPSISPTGD